VELELLAQEKEEESKKAVETQLATGQTPRLLQVMPTLLYST
jgi:hypothetical protein